MTYERWQYYERQQGFKQGLTQGLTQGIAQQKAEDEKLLKKTVAKLTAQKDALINSKDAENARLNERIAQLEALLAQK